MRPASLIRLVPCLAACGALAFAASGCGTSATLDPVAQAAQVTQHAGGSRMALTASVNVPGVAAPIGLSGDGFFNYKAHEGSFTLTMSGLPAAAAQLTGGGDLKIDERIKGTTVFVGSALFAGKFPGGASWLKLDLARFGSSYGLSPQQLTGGESNPGQLLDYLKASAGGVKQVGRARVRGVATTRYRGSIDLGKLVDQAPSSARAQMRDALDRVIQQTGLRFVPMEVWVDAANRVRRFALSLAVAQQGQTFSTQVNVELFDFGPTPTVAVPPAGETFDITQTALSKVGKAG